jgi:hypothetical protein
MRLLGLRRETAAGLMVADSKHTHTHTHTQRERGGSRSQQQVTHAGMLTPSGAAVHEMHENQLGGKSS